MSDLVFTGASTLVNCYGRYSGNVMNQPNIGVINTALDNLGYTGPDVTFAAFDATKINFSGEANSVINFPGVFNGTLYFGLKVGNGGPQGVGRTTTFYKINAVNLDHFRFAPSGASSGGFFLVPAPPIPEPATWAMLILGFGAVGGAMRSASKRRATLAFG